MDGFDTSPASNESNIPHLIKILDVLILFVVFIWLKPRILKMPDPMFPILSARSEIRLGAAVGQKLIEDMQNVKANCTEPELCITFISCNRPYFLELNLQRLLAHINRLEPWLCYEMNWIDQATPNRSRFSEAYKFHKRLLISKKTGYPFSFTHAFSMCQAPYMLLLEEDIILKEDVNFPLISHALELLKSFPDRIYGIVMRRVWKSPGDRFIPINGTTQYANMSAWNVRRGLYRWNNGGILVRMSNVHQILARAPYLSEEQFSTETKKLGFTYAIMGPTGSTPFTDLYINTWFFDHAGEDGNASSIHNKEICSGESFS